MDLLCLPAAACIWLPMVEFDQVWCFECKFHAFWNASKELHSSGTKNYEASMHIHWHDIQKYPEACHKKDHLCLDHVMLQMKMGTTNGGEPTCNVIIFIFWYIEFEYFYCFLSIFSAKASQAFIYSLLRKESLPNNMKKLSCGTQKLSILQS